MEKITKAEWDKIPAGGKGVWTTNKRTDFGQVRSLDTVITVGDMRRACAAIAKATGTEEVK